MVADNSQFVWLCRIDMGISVGDKEAGMGMFVGRHSEWLDVNGDCVLLGSVSKMDVLVL